MSLTLNLLQVREEGKNQAVCRKLHVCVQFYPWFKFYFLLFLGMVMYDIDMIMSLKQKKITGICRIHFGLADCRSIGRTCITWPEFPAETIAANRKQKSATRMVPKAVGDPPPLFLDQKKKIFLETTPSSYLRVWMTEPQHPAIGRLLVTLSTPKNLSLKGVTAAPTFVERGDQTRTAVTVLQFPNGNGGLLMD